MSATTNHGPATVGAPELAADYAGWVGRNGESWSQIRAQFPILDQVLPNGRPLVYLDTAATSQKPRRVLEKIRECFEQYNSNVHRGIHTLGDRMTTELEAAREKVQQLIGARESDEIIFTSGTTMSLNLVAIGWARKHLRPEDVILVNDAEHHANLVPWQMVAKATGASLEFLPYAADGQLDRSAWDAAFSARVRLVAVAGMSNMLGTVHPIRELAERAHAVGAKLVVDGAQSVPHDLTNVLADGIDFLAFSGHKLYGPTGVGVLYGRREWLEEMDPVFGGGHMIREVFRDHSTWADPPAKFEAGTAPFIEAVGLGAAIDFVLEQGLERLAAYEHSLTVQALRLLGEIPGLTIYGPAAAHRGAIVSFTVDQVHPHDLSDLLDRQGVAIRAGHHCTMPLHDRLGIAASARASFAIYNSPAEVQTLADAIREARKVFRLPD